MIFLAVALYLIAGLLFGSGLIFTKQRAYRKGWFGGMDYELLCMQATILTVTWPAVIPFGLLLAFFRWLSARLEGDDE